MIVFFLVRLLYESIGDFFKEPERMPERKGYCYFHSGNEFIWQNLLINFKQ
jgi:hypothetical protein